MPLSISRLRRWFAVAAIAALLLVAGAYFYARHRVQNALKQVPEKIGLDIQQTATGFTVSKSEQGRTLFKIEASKAVQFKQGNRAELHDVAITVYGRDSGRFDRIYGENFEYDQRTGNVTANGEVRIDLEANPQGLVSPDQAPPRELKEPIRLKTSGLVFSQKTGDAYTKEKVEFSLPQATGSAVGVHYVASTTVLTLESQVVIDAGSPAATLQAARATITKNPRWVVLDHPVAKNAGRTLTSDQATVYLRADNTIGRIVAQGNVQIASEDPSRTVVRSTQSELNMAGQPNLLRTAIFTGDVRMESGGPQPAEASAASLTVSFGQRNSIEKAHAEDHVRILQHQNPSSATAQDLEVNASVLDVAFAGGNRIRNAEAYGGPSIAIRPGQNARSHGQQTTVNAARFDARFDPSGQLTSVHGEPDASIVNSSPGQPDRVSTSVWVDAVLHPGSGIESIVQQGSVVFSDGERKAWGDRARYTPADQMLVLSGSPRVTDANLTTTARAMRMNRATGDAFAEGDVKSTYSDLKPQPNGALLASASPIHVAAKSMTVHGTSAIALYTGNARLWQDANAVDAPSIVFDRNQRSIIASGSAGQAVSTMLEQTDKGGKSVPVAITSSRLSYKDDERRVHFEGGVVAKSTDLTITSAQVDAFLDPRGPVLAAQSPRSTGKLDKIVASGQVVVTQPNRQATGDRLVYTTEDDKFVLTGGPPSIFDAEHGKITGVSLTLFGHDDRVVVEGSNSAPTVTETRVAR
jgi:lipopolysaccharide export system protein LptA